MDQKRDLMMDEWMEVMLENQMEERKDASMDIRKVFELVKVLDFLMVQSMVMHLESLLG